MFHAAALEEILLRWSEVRILTTPKAVAADPRDEWTKPKSRSERVCGTGMRHTLSERDFSCFYSISSLPCR